MEEKKPHVSYLETLSNELRDHNLYYEMLNKRLALIKANNSYTEKSEFEKNEIEICIVETKGKLAALRKVITEREKYFKGYAEQYEKDSEECDKNFDAVLELAKQKAPKNKILNEEINAIVWENVNSIPEVKVTLYKRLKQLAV